MFVYNVDDAKNPQFKQVLPAGVALAVPSRNALFVASEVDERKNKMRSVANIYELGAEKPNYPSLQSVHQDVLPVAWSAMSGLAADAHNEGILYVIEDSFLKPTASLKLMPIKCQQKSLPPCQSWIAMAYSKILPLAKK